MAKPFSMQELKEAEAELERIDVPPKTKNSAQRLFATIRDRDQQIKDLKEQLLARIENDRT